MSVIPLKLQTIPIPIRILYGKIALEISFYSDIFSVTNALYTYYIFHPGINSSLLQQKVDENTILFFSAITGECCSFRYHNGNMKNIWIKYVSHASRMFKSLHCEKICDLKHFHNCSHFHTRKIYKNLQMTRMHF